MNNIFSLPLQLGFGTQSPVSFGLQAYLSSILLEVIGAYAAVFIHRFDEGSPGTGG
jgi:hypothetical protein